MSIIVIHDTMTPTMGAVELRYIGFMSLCCHAQRRKMGIEGMDWSGCGEVWEVWGVWEVRGWELRGVWGGMSGYEGTVECVCGVYGEASIMLMYMPLKKVSNTPMPRGGG
jgi:hypothetical protein